jgi:hypothetical protein
MVTRRALLGAGALLVVGCGPPEEAEVVPEDVLTEQLRVTKASVAALEAEPQLRARAQERAAALEQAGATAPDPTDGPADALAAVRAELASHVQAVGLLEEAEYRTLFAKLVAGAAADESALMPVRELTAFPGTP